MRTHLGELLPRAAARFGLGTALVVEGRRFSFRELDALANRFANALLRLGLRPGDRVTLYAANSWEWIVVYHGVLRAGGVINPINVMLTPAEVAFVVGDCGARIVVASAEKAGPLADLRAATRLEHLVSFGGDTPAGGLAFERLLEDAPDDPVTVERRPDDLSTIGYTSGTTGHPKGAMQSHRAVLHNIAMTATMHVRTAADTVVTALPCPHVYGNVVVNGSLMTGGTLVLMPRFDPGEALALIAAHRATMFEGVPTMFLYMLALPGLERFDLTSLTRCTVGGQTMSVAKMAEVEERFGCPLLELWGMTEIAGVGTTHPFYGGSRLGSIGVPLPMVECRIAAVEEPSRTLPAGEVGELMIRGPIVMQGYFGNEAATRETIEPDGWLHSGDLARQDEEGFVTIVDRRKDMILTAGYNVYPAEIERVIAAHPAVALVAVGPVADAFKGEIAKAYVVLKPGAAATADDIVAHCRGTLASYKVPRAVAFVADLPKTSTGKIMRRMLKTVA